MLELEVHNFQSVLRAKVVVDGFTAIEGRSNIGKSAFIRAVQCALTGAVGTDFVRHGPACERYVRGNKKCSCFSTVIFRSSKLTLTWEKGDNVNRYTVVRPDIPTPEVFNGLERGTPLFLLPDFQMVQIGAKKELVQIPDQFEPIFLLNQSGPSVADVLSDVARLDCINKAMVLVSKDRKEVTSKRKVREEDVKNLTDSLGLYSGLDDVPIKVVEALGVRLRKAQQTLSQVEGYISKLQGLKVTLQALFRALEPNLPDLLPLETTYSGLVQVEGFQVRALANASALLDLSMVLKPELPSVDPLLNTNSSLVCTNGFLVRYQERTQILGVLTGVDQVDVPDVPKLDDSFDVLQRISSLTQRLKTVTEVIDRYKDLDQVIVPDESKLLQLWPQISQLEESLQKYTRLQADIFRGDMVQEASNISMDNILERLETFSKISLMLNRLSALKTVFLTSKQEHEAVEVEVRQTIMDLEALGTCPTCSQSFAKGQHLHLEGL
jgi:hypothetical protein